MSKSTKIIAGLGVAAALGVAALPMASFADSGDYATVTVSATVPDAISMTVDSNTADSTGTVEGNAIEFGTIAHGGYKVSGDTNSESDTIASNVSIVSSNAAYNFKIENTSTGTNGALASAASEIAGFATATTPAADAATSGWGFHVIKGDSQTPEGTAGDVSNATYKHSVITAGKYIAVPTVATTLDAVAAPAQTITGTYTVTYGIQIAEGQAAGEYTGSVVYSVTDNN